MLPTLTNSCVASWTLFGIRINPIGSFWIVVALFDPFFDQVASDWIMPIFGTCKTKFMPTSTRDGFGLHMRHFHGISAIWSGAPSHQSITLKNEKIDFFIFSFFFQIGKTDISSYQNLTWTKLLVIKCWYLSLILESLTNLMTVWSSTRMSQLEEGHSIDWLAPSSMILVARYSVQHEVQ